MSKRWLPVCRISICLIVPVISILACDSARGQDANLPLLSALKDPTLSPHCPPAVLDQLERFRQADQLRRLDGLAGLA